MTMTVADLVLGGQALGVDYSFHHPDPGAIRRAGYSFVVRYLWPADGTEKGLTVAERDELWAAGLGIAVIYEAGASDVLGGAATGAAEGHTANSLADALGYPAGMPIFYATDFDEPAGDFPANSAYLAAAARGGRPDGPYGEDALVESIVGGGLCHYGWQSEAWSGTVVSAHANLYQRVSPTLPAIPGGGYDENVMLVPMPLWTGNTPTPVPQPKPTPPPSPTPPAPVPPARRNIFTPLGVDGVFGLQTTKAEQFVSFGGNVAACDGLFGLASKKSMQAHLGVNADGIIGPVTVEALQRRVGATPDGMWGPVTTEKLQAALNAGTY